MKELPKTIRANHRLVLAASVALFLFASGDAARVYSLALQELRTLREAQDRHTAAAREAATAHATEGLDRLSLRAVRTALQGAFPGQTYLLAPEARYSVQHSEVVRLRDPVHPRSLFSYRMRLQSPGAYFRPDVADLEAAVVDVLRETPQDTSRRELMGIRILQDGAEIKFRDTKDGTLSETQSVRVTLKKGNFVLFTIQSWLVANKLADTSGSVLPALSRKEVWDQVHDQTLSEAERTLQERASGSKKTLSLLGVLDVEARNAVLFGPLVIVGLLVNLLLHLRAADHEDFRLFPWIPVYHGWQARCFGIATTLLLPAGAQIQLLYTRGWPLPSFREAIGWGLFLLSAVLGVAILWQVEKVRSKLGRDSLYEAVLSHLPTRTKMRLDDSSPKGP